MMSLESLNYKNDRLKQKRWRRKIIMLDKYSRVTVVDMNCENIFMFKEQICRRLSYCIFHGKNFSSCREGQSWKGVYTCIIFPSCEISYISHIRFINKLCYYSSRSSNAIILLFYYLHICFLISVDPIWLV